MIGTGCEDSHDPSYEYAKDELVRSSRVETASETETESAGDGSLPNVRWLRRPARGSAAATPTAARRRTSSPPTLDERGAETER